MKNLSAEIQLITLASAGDYNGDQQSIAQTGIELLATILQKNSDYGSAVWTPPMLVPDLDIDSSILIRIGDKIQRLQSIAQKPAEFKGESFDDTLKDLAGYCILLLANPKREKRQENDHRPAPPPPPSAGPTYLEAP